MKKLYLPFIFIFLSSYATAQSVKGIIYEDNTTAQRILINNTTQNIRTYSDNEGFFTIKAKVNDTLTVGSLFHNIKTIVLKPEHFNETIVVEIKKIINTLNEVYISNEPATKEFEAKAYTETVNNQIKEDIKRRPYLYGLQPSSNMDIIAIANLIGKLFKSQKTKKEAFEVITYDDLISLFESDSFFNHDLLYNQLKIPSNYKYLFFEYCDAQQLNKKLIKNESDFLLLDALLTSSAKFMDILENHKKD